MSNIIYGVGNPGEVIDNSLPEFDNWSDSTNGEIHVSGDPSSGLYLRPNFTLTEKLELSRTDMVQRYKKEAVERMQIVMPAIDNLGMVELLAALWPTIDSTKAGDDLLLVKDIYLFAKSRIIIIKIATQEEIDVADPTTDSWPV